MSMKGFVAMTASKAIGHTYDKTYSLKSIQAVIIAKDAPKNIKSWV